MTTLASIRVRLNKLEKQIQALKEEFDQIVNTLIRPSDDKKGD